MLFFRLNIGNYLLLQLLGEVGNLIVSFVGHVFGLVYQAGLADAQFGIQELHSSRNINVLFRELCVDDSHSHHFFFIKLTQFLCLLSEIFPLIIDLLLIVFFKIINFTVFLLLHD